MNLHFLITIGACAVTGLVVLILERREQKRLYTRMLESRERAIAEMHQKSVAYGITQFQLGVKAGRIAERRDTGDMRSVAFLTGDGCN